MEHITDPVLDVTLACPDCRLVGRDCACGDRSECPACGVEDCGCGPDDVLATDL